MAATPHKIPQVFLISFGKVGHAIELIEVKVLGNGHRKERMTSRGGICHDSRNKRDQRGKSS